MSITIFTVLMSALTITSTFFLGKSLTTSKSSSSVSYAKSLGHSAEVGIVDDQCLSQPTDKVSEEFLVIGHAGGDPHGACENTLDATRSALRSDSVNAVEIDLSISADGTVFLWHDPNPHAMSTTMRRLGLGLPGVCLPYFMPEGLVSANKLKFTDIQRLWGYKESIKVDGKFADVPIPTLDDWLKEFAGNSKLKIIWMDVKVQSARSLKTLVAKLKHLFQKHNLTADRIMFSVSDDHRAAVFQQILTRYQMKGYRVVSDTVSFSAWINDDGPDGISKGLSMCGCCANLGAPPIAANRYSSLKRFVASNVARRDRLSKLTMGQKQMSIFIWTIDDPKEMAWLVRSGVDGIITNRPGTLTKMLLFKGKRGKQK